VGKDKVKRAGCCEGGRVGKDKKVKEDVVRGGVGGNRYER